MFVHVHFTVFFYDNNNQMTQKPDILKGKQNLKNERVNSPSEVVPEWHSVAPVWWKPNLITSAKTSLLPLEIVPRQDPIILHGPSYRPPGNPSTSTWRHGRTRLIGEAVDEIRRERGSATCAPGYAARRDQSDQDMNFLHVKCADLMAVSKWDEIYGIRKSQERQKAARARMEQIREPKKKRSVSECRTAERKNFGRGKGSRALEGNLRLLPRAHEFEQGERDEAKWTKRMCTL